MVRGSVSERLRMLERAVDGLRCPLCEAESPVEVVERLPPGAEVHPSPQDGSSHLRVAVVVGPPCGGCGRSRERTLVLDPYSPEPDGTAWSYTIDLSAGDALFVAIADHQRARARQIAQGLKRPFGLSLLKNGDAYDDDDPEG